MSAEMYNDGNDGRIGGKRRRLRGSLNESEEGTCLSSYFRDDQDSDETSALSMTIGNNTNEGPSPNDGTETEEITADLNRLSRQPIVSTSVYYPPTSFSKPLFVNSQNAADSWLLEKLESLPVTKKRKGGTDWHVMYTEAFSLPKKFLHGRGI